jgi:hypothetical protein
MSAVNASTNREENCFFLIQNLELFKNDAWIYYERIYNENIEDIHV